MLKKTLAAAVVLAVAGAFSFDAASAATATGSVPGAAIGNPTIQAAYVVKKKVVVKKHGNVTKKTVVVRKHGTVNKKVWVYDSHRYGLRYHNKVGKYIYYYDGYYYERPWWTLPGFGICIGC